MSVSEWRSVRLPDGRYLTGEFDPKTDRWTYFAAHVSRAYRFALDEARRPADEHGGVVCGVVRFLDFRRGYIESEL